jgi:hypothetical protein
MVLIGSSPTPLSPIFPYQRKKEINIYKYIFTKKEIFRAVGIRWQPFLSALFANGTKQEPSSNTAGTQGEQNRKHGIDVVRQYRRCQTTKKREQERANRSNQEQSGDIQR